MSSSIIKNCNYNLVENNSNARITNLENGANKTQTINANNFLINQKTFLHDSITEKINNRKNLKSQLNHTNSSVVNNQNLTVVDETNLSQNINIMSKAAIKICTKTAASSTTIDCDCDEEKSKKKEIKKCALNLENNQTKLLLSNRNDLQKVEIENREMNENEAKNQKKCLFNKKLNNQSNETEFIESDNNKIINNKNDITTNKTINCLVRPTTLAFFQNFPSVVCQESGGDNEINENQTKYMTESLDENFAMQNSSSAAAAALLKCCQLNSAATTLSDIGSFCGTATSSPYSLSTYSEQDTPITTNNLLQQQQQQQHQQQRTNSLQQQNDLEQTATNFLYPYQAYGISPSSLEFNMFWSAATVATPWNFAAAVNATNPIALAPNETVSISELTSPHIESAYNNQQSQHQHLEQQQQQHQQQQQQNHLFSTENNFDLITRQSIENLSQASENRNLSFNNSNYSFQTDQENPYYSFTNQVRLYPQLNYNQTELTEENKSTELPSVLSAAAVAAAGFMTLNTNNTNTNNTISCYPTMHSAQSNRKGGRKPREIEQDIDLTDEDKDKRAKRRQRNKEAAARCRKRRLDQMNSLQSEVDDLKVENLQKQSTIEQLIQQKERLEQILQHNNCLLAKEHNNEHQIHQIHHHNLHQHIQQQELLLPSSLSCGNSSSDYLLSLRNNQQCLMPPPKSMHTKSPTHSSRVSRHNGSPVVSSQSTYNSSIPFKLSTNDSMIVGAGSPLYKEELIISGSSPSNVQFTDSTSNCSIIMNNDPVISDAALSRIIKRPKLEDDGYERPTTLSLSNNSFDSVNLNTITTPSHGLITPGLLNGSEYSLLHQRTFLTPVNGPMLVQRAASPQNRDLRQL